MAGYPKKCRSVGIKNKCHGGQGNCIAVHHDPIASITHFVKNSNPNSDFFYAPYHGELIRLPAGRQGHDSRRWITYKNTCRTELWFEAHIRSHLTMTYKLFITSP